MCGIAGIMASTRGGVDAAALDALGRALAHRGPDGDGRFADDHVGLAHTRLSIIGLDDGAQPLYGPGGEVLVANGEIYNYIELRREFPDYAFRTGSDCEVILALYRRHGLDFARHLRGMYALALYDPAAGRLVLARDPFGIKPLYVAETPAGLAFASEPRAFIAAGLLSASVQPSKALEVIDTQMIEGGTTIYEGVERIAPGETVVVEGGRIVERRRLRPLADREPLHSDEPATLEALEKVWLSSVELHQRSDVPFGLFLSGGVDSSAVLAAMARLFDRPVRAYAAGFPGASVADERDQARRVAGALGAEFVDVPVTEEMFWSHLPEMVAASDDPVADYAAVPTWLLARRAREDVKVVLTGEGGDEMFAGYGRYRSASRLLLPKPVRRGDGLLSGLGLTRGGKASPRDRQKLRTGWRQTRLQRAQWEDISTWLPDDLLLKLDRNLMWHGVEGRVPFVDPEMARFAFHLPDGLKLRGKAGKYILKRWLEGVCPQAEPFSKKRGFTVPVRDWIAARADRLGPLVAAQPGIAELCRPDAVREVFKGGGKTALLACWRLTYYALWHHIHILGAPHDGDIMGVLAARP